ncbi:MAG: hypothetical protein KatS3mg050_2933 [Litorilinea sp.]|nr:MAG: hypothetical protein KatS3mg050_2933 [Litorilinea sp.]
MSSRRWSTLTKIIVISTLAILAIVLLVTFREMIPPTVVAFLLAFILSYPVNWIQRTTGWARGTAVTVIYIILLALVALMPALLIPRSAELFLSLQAALEDLVTSLQTASAGPLLVLGNYRLSLDTVLQEAGNVLQNVLILATTNPMSIARGVTAGVLTVVYVLVLNFWLLKDLHKLQRLIYEQIPADYQEDVRRLAQSLGEVWHAFLRGQLVLGLVVGLMTWIALAIVGMPNAGGLALLAGVMEFLPTIGPGISGTIGTAVALFSGSTWMPVGNITFALVVMAIYIVITQIESVYLIPRLVGGRVQLHPAVTFVGIINGAMVFGVLGVLLATPTIASARILLSYVYRKLLDLEPFEPIQPLQPGVRIPGLIAGRKIEAVIFDLDGTLAPLDWRACHWAAQHLTWLDRLVPPVRRSYLARRAMILLEGFINFLINQLRHLNLQQDLARLSPLLDSLRGYPPAADLRPFPGVAETLAQLATHYRLVLVSTRSRQEIEQFLNQGDLDPNLFQLVIGREDVRNLLPHSEALLAAAQHLQLEPDQILVVSDTDINLRSARAAQMATAGVLCGLGEAQDLAEADLVLSSPLELTEWL